MDNQKKNSLERKTQHTHTLNQGSTFETKLANCFQDLKELGKAMLSIQDLMDEETSNWKSLKAN